MRWTSKRGRGEAGSHPIPIASDATKWEIPTLLPKTLWEWGARFLRGKAEREQESSEIGENQVGADTAKLSSIEGD